MENLGKSSQLDNIMTTKNNLSTNEFLDFESKLRQQKRTSAQKKSKTMVELPGKRRFKKQNKA
jgi:hypothetical protein